MGQVTPSGEQPPTVSRKSTGDPPGAPSQLPDLSCSREILCLETALVFHHQFFALEPQRAKHGPPARPAFRLARRQGTKLGPLPLPTRTHRRSRAPGPLRRPRPRVCPCRHARAHSHTQGCQGQFRSQIKVLFSSLHNQSHLPLNPKRSLPA